MTSHVRHRRAASAAPFTGLLEPGEIAVNTFTRQLATGAPDGTPLKLLAVRYFDQASFYNTFDFVVKDDGLYSAKEDISPGVFDPTKWHLASAAVVDPVDPEDMSSYLLKTGGIMTGVLELAADPITDFEAATKQYVDNSIPPAPPIPTAGDIAVTPVGDVAAVTVQAAIAELDTEKFPYTGGELTGMLTLFAAPTDDLHAASKLFAETFATNAVDAMGELKVNIAGDTMEGELIVSHDIQANRTATTGCIFLGSDKAHYLLFDGTKYNLPAGGLTLGGAVTGTDAAFDGALSAKSSDFRADGNHIIHTTQSFAAAALANLQVTGPYPTIGFHMPGVFGANFGMNTDGNFYMGGSSFGAGNYFKFHTSRDGAMVTAVRMVHVGDSSFGYGTGLNEPFGRTAAVTGLSGVAVDINTLSGSFYARFAQLQVMVDGAWYAVGGA